MQSSTTVLSFWFVLFIWSLRNLCLPFGCEGIFQCRLLEAFLFCLSRGEPRRIPPGLDVYVRCEVRGSRLRAFPAWMSKLASSVYSRHHLSSTVCAYRAVCGLACPRSVPTYADGAPASLSQVYSFGYLIAKASHVVPRLRGCLGSFLTLCVSFFSV